MLSANWQDTNEKLQNSNLKNKKFVKWRIFYLAGVLGFEPRLRVLETLVLTVDTIPL